METQSANNALAPWVGRSCIEVRRYEFHWSFAFGEGNAITVECPWRIVAEGKIAVTDTDDGQMFGHGTPVSGVETAWAMLANKKVLAIEVAPITGDLTLEFEQTTWLQLFNGSSGHEAWVAEVKNGPACTVVAQGGGRVVILAR